MPAAPRTYVYFAVFGVSALLYAGCGSDAPNGAFSAFQAQGDADGTVFQTRSDGGVGDGAAAVDGGPIAADTGAPDTGAAGASDAEAIDVVGGDAGAADTALPDTGGADAEAMDTAAMDTAAMDTAAMDTAAVDTGANDIGVLDSGTTDTASGDTATGDTSSPDGGTTDGGSTTTAKEFNGGFVGGACTTDSQCAYAGGQCLKDSAGFPNGMCTQSCTKFCPDKAGMATTFCISAKDVSVSTPPGLCTARCDYSKSPTGCRPGYKCAKLQRYGDPATSMFACIPGLSTGGGGLTDCQQKLLARGVGFSPQPNPWGVPTGGTAKVCDIPDLLSVNPDMYGVGFRASSQTGSKLKMKMNCQFAHSVADMAELLAKKGIVEVVHYGTYNCRYISGTKTLSEHAFANALDVAGLKDKDGNYHSVLNDWEKGVKTPKTASGTLLKWFADTMYAKHVFNIILTPEYNAAHANHFHVDDTPGSWFMQGFTSIWQTNPGCSLPHDE